jgi:hypothetical protein
MTILKLKLYGKRLKVENDGVEGDEDDHHQENEMENQQIESEINNMVLQKIMIGCDFMCEMKK